MARRSSLFLKIFVCILIGLALAVAGHSWWLAALGKILVADEGAVRADIAVVLAGDFSGHRILTGAELVKKGYVPKVLVSGPKMVYGLYECDLAIPFAVQHGYPEEWFIREPNSARSTREEAAVILPDLRRRGVHRFLLVTSDYHTARAGRIYRADTQGLEMRIVAAPDDNFHPYNWWQNREGQKLFFIEWSKTVANILGM